MRRGRKEKTRMAMLMMRRRRKTKVDKIVKEYVKLNRNDKEVKTKKKEINE